MFQPSSQQVTHFPQGNMEGQTRPRLNEQDMNQRLQHFQQQRQDIELPRPPIAYMGAPPSPVTQQMPYPPPPQHRPHPNHINTGRRIPSPQGQAMPHHPLHDPLYSAMAEGETSSNSKHTTRQRITCVHPNVPNRIRLVDPDKTPQPKIIGARILSVTIPITDYNVDEHTNILLASMNYLDANANQWQPVVLPIGNYQSRRKLLNALVEALSVTFPSVQFKYQYDHHGDGRCSIESITILNDVKEHGCHALYLGVSNHRLLALLGFQVEKDQLFVEPTSQWNVADDTDELTFHHARMVAPYPMNLLLPTHLNLDIPELGTSMMIPLHKARYGDYHHFEFIDEDGVVDLTHAAAVAEFGGCSALGQLTPRLTYSEGTPDLTTEEREYNCRNIPIALHVEFLLETH